jgi:hypothetical protein
MMKRILLIVLIIAIITNGASASKIDKEKKIDCDTNENVKEEIVGLTEDGSDFIVKRVLEQKITKPSRPSSGGACYKLMGIKWNNLPVTYSINPSNPDGLSEDIVTSKINLASNTWEDATSVTLFSYNGITTLQYGARDNNNVLSFGRITDSNTIAVTTVWYTRIGKRILETDMLFNTFYRWGDASSNPALMDLQNIATHEFGHTFGMDDLYNSCYSQTMYGYSSEGDVEKRTLESGDIAGLISLYGI